ncbi:hypothetical protein [Sorangium sp. So ce1335]|uniref:hypothetical protein n=1 Tax=Sorangium sp. So ce1335 TaxID=3133335 RepID=UPI003F637232
MFRTALGALALFLVSVTAFATHASIVLHYFTQFHFTGQAFGKKVKSVKVHAGALQRACDDSIYWLHVQDLDMTERDGKFNARAVLVGFSDIGCDANLGAIVQYFVTFEDGSTMITQPAMIPSRSLGAASGEQSLEKMKEALLRAPDADETSAQIVETTIVN